MRVAVTGGTGYAGPAVVEEMLREGHEVVVLEHRRPLPVPDHPRLKRVRGDINDAASLKRALHGCDAVAHLVAIIREQPANGVTFERVHVAGTRNVVEAAREQGVRRLLLMSANGAEADDTPYFTTKLAMERIVKDAGFEWTIFRPSYIAGSEEGGFDAQFADIVDKAPLLPSFAGGRFEIQPVARRNVGEAFARALSRPHAVGKTYVLTGPERFTWNEYLRRLARLRGKRPRLAYVPRPFILGVATVLKPVFPADPDQLRMLMKGNAGDGSEAVRDLDLELISGETAVAGLARK